MANAELNKSTWYVSEPISGHFIISVDEEDPAIPSIDILNSGLEFILKDDKSKADSEALAVLTIGNGLEVIENTSILYNVVYKIPGAATRNVKPVNPRDTSVTLFFELNITYLNETESNVLETGTIKLRVDRVKSTFS